MSQLALNNIKVADDELAAADLVGVLERRKTDLLGGGDRDRDTGHSSSLTLSPVGGDDLRRSLASSLKPRASRRPRSGSVFGRRDDARRSSLSVLTAVGFDFCAVDCRITSTPFGSGLLSGNIGRVGFIKV